LPTVSAHKRSGHCPLRASGTDMPIRFWQGAKCSMPVPVAHAAARLCRVYLHAAVALNLGAGRPVLNDPEPRIAQGCGMQRLYRLCK